ncbi:MAG: acetoacetate--CoA ligase [Hyphomicrobium sp.]
MAHLPLWIPEPEQVASCSLTSFLRFIAPRFGDMDVDQLHAWSVSDSENFWSEFWDFAGIVGDKGAAPFVATGARLEATRFFPQSRLNYAENALRYANCEQEIVFWGEHKVKSRMSGDELRVNVGAFQRVLRAAGVEKGDRVAAILPNMPEAICAFLATSSIGAIWSSCSPDFGEQGILDRFGQIEPKVLVVADGYFYAGKTIDISEKVAAVVQRLPSVEQLYVVNYIGLAGASLDRINAIKQGSAAAFDAALQEAGKVEPHFERLPFDHPLCILFSSGTTGVPKCIVHRAGGILIKHLSEHILHTDVRRGDRLFYFTTLGWMMWNWLVSGLATGASLLLYDGSPTYSTGDILWRLAEKERCTHFGTSAKYIDTIKKQQLGPGHTHNLSALRAILSTGSPLSPECFYYVYHAIKDDVHLASISGGTDICGCFVLGYPTKPVWRGEIQGPAFGLQPDIVDDAGRPLTSGKGELVCRNAFPSMPIGFWNDDDGTRYRKAYFERIPGIWHHGDFAEWTENGGVIIHGRSDATLNPGGVRIGTAEIYRVLEGVPAIQEAVAIGQDWNGDVRVLLFVVLKEGCTLDANLSDLVKRRIKDGASPRHVPALVIAARDIPRTRSGKISELAVRDTVMGRPINNTEALANPECLEQFAPEAWRHLETAARESRPAVGA